VPALTTKSLDRLDTCDPRLQRIAKMAIARTDFIVLCGYRSRAEQEDAFERGATKLHWPNSKHNASPSQAFDLAPVPIDWNNLEAFRNLARIILEEAGKLGIRLRWGGDFNMNGKPDDKFVDMPHFELLDPPPHGG
jgi:peptidoglycan L-alanyl-D-glutamate endopeptidase CwlK